MPEHQTMHIREQLPGDYEAIAHIVATIYPENAETAAEIEYFDQHRATNCRWQRFVAEENGQIVGMASFEQFAWIYHPHKFHLSVEVLPAHQRLGTGRALYQQLLSALAPYQPVCLRTRVREDNTAGLHFAAGRGFVEEERTWESRLAPAGFDFTPYQYAFDRLVQQGITLSTVADLASDPQRNEKLYHLARAATQGEPSVEPLTPPNKEQYLTDSLHNPNCLPDAWFIALDGDHYVGESSLWRMQAHENELDVGFTGVRPEYRGRGIALALKLRTIAYAQAHGITRLVTFNSSLNQPMLAINERLGFEKQPAWIGLRKDLAT